MIHQQNEFSAERARRVDAGVEPARHAFVAGQGDEAQRRSAKLPVFAGVLRHQLEQRGLGAVVHDDAFVHLSLQRAQLLGEARDVRIERHGHARDARLHRLRPESNSTARPMSAASQAHAM